MLLARRADAALIETDLAVEVPVAEPPLSFGAPKGRISPRLHE
jgi:hypothetical protein